MKIRHVQPEDKNEWLRMRATLWPTCPFNTQLAEIEEYLGLDSAVRAWGCANIPDNRLAWGCKPTGAENRLGGKQVGAVFVAVRPAGGLCGFLEVSIRPYADGCDTRHVGYIEGWYVEADCRQQGVGAALVQQAEAWAIEQGCQEMASDCLLNNELSLRAHLALGYQEMERLIHFKKALVATPFTTN